ncbi:amino acid ABC transporter permease [Caballeronia sordidicola]|jgi:His/Glu/Gln/Arg/opine family amino acid ABC transporter permease subunit|nr:amino acid ABC transporter permease [Caballeronia sordidicola]
MDLSSLDWSVVWSHWPLFLQGVGLDLYMAVAGFLLACVVGLVVAQCRISGTRILSTPAYIFIQIVRGVPFYVLLLWLYFGLATAMKLSLSPTAAAIVALAITGSGLTAEIFRGSFEAIDRGQLEASRSLGMRWSAIYTDILLPQALRTALPPLGNVFVFLLKAATYAAVISVPEIVYVAQDISTTFFKPFEAFSAVAVILVVLVVTFSLIVAATERSLKGN